MTRFRDDDRFRLGRWVLMLVVLGQAACKGDDRFGQSPGQMADPSVAAGMGAPAEVAGSGGAAGSAPQTPVPMAGAGAAGMAAAGGAGSDALPPEQPPAADAGSMTDAMVIEEPPRPDQGEGDGSDVITIGDSWMSLGTTGIQQSLVRASGQPYRTYGRGGTRLLNGVIPGQYTTAKQADPNIETVVMTGGGNDIIQVPGLRADCDAGGEMCAMVVGQILDALTELWTEMAADGVQDVIYVEYSNPEGRNVDFALPSGDSAVARCADVPEPLRCHTLETLDIVMGDIPDGIHPSSAAYDRIGQAVYDMMVERGMRR